MFSLDKFLEFFRDSKTLIPTLLAIILVGSIGGGLWIHTLNEKIDLYKNVSETLDRLAQKQLKSVEDDKDEALNRARGRLGDVTYDAERILRQNRELDDSIAPYIEHIESVIKSAKAPGSDQALLYLSKIKNEYAAHEKDLNKIDSVVRGTKLVSLDHSSDGSEETSGIHPPVVFYILFLIVGCFIIYYVCRLIKWSINKAKNRKNK